MAQRRLDKEVDGEDYLRKADSFLFTARFLGNLPMGLMAPMMAPLIISYAFSTELYLKVLSQLERGGPPLFGHDLKQLVGDISPKSIRRIKRAWKEYNRASIKTLKTHPQAPEWAKSADTFEKCLEVSSKAFIDFRYGERGDLIGWQFGGVADELREMILELRPEWRVTTGPRTSLDPQPKFVEPKNNDAGRPAGWAILNRQPPGFYVKGSGRPDPKDGSSNKGS